MRQSLPVTLVESSGDQRLVVEAVKICKTYDAGPIFPLHPDTQQTFALSTAGKSCLLQEIKPIVLKKNPSDKSVLSNMCRDFSNILI